MRISSCRRPLGGGVSYDLHVYAEDALTSDELQSLLESDLRVDQEGSSATSLIVVRGAKSLYCFTLCLPVTVQAEDVPDEVLSVLMTATVLYEISVEGSAASAVPHAVKFARALAAQTTGAAFDPQTDEIWTHGKLRTSPRLERGLIDIVQFTWYARNTAEPSAAAESWLRLARRHLPEALPRRYGSYEPLSMAYDPTSPNEFAAFAADSRGSVFFKGTSPVFEGSLGDSSRSTIAGHLLTVQREALVDQRWRTAVRELFLRFAHDTEAVLATAEVVRDVGWSGRGLTYGRDAERTTYLAARGQWAGLPPYPVWWTYFGAEYVPLVRAHLPGQQVEVSGAGLFQSMADEPQDRDALFGVLRPTPIKRGALRRLIKRNPPSDDPAPWLPVALLAVVDIADARLHNPPLTPADVRPASLTGA